MTSSAAHAYDNTSTRHNADAGSVTITICTNDRIDIVDADRSAGSAARGIQDLVKSGSIGLLNEVLEQVLLQRLVRSRRTLPQYRVSPLGDSPNQNACHPTPCTFLPFSAVAQLAAGEPLRFAGSDWCLHRSE